jgi:hypothetical protein
MAGLALIPTVAACDNQTASDQAPAPVSGTVTSRPPCQPHHACSFLVALVPGALVVANGKDGVHEAHADAHGHFQIYLLEGLWTLRASRTASAAQGPSVSVDVRAGQARQVTLQVAS